MNFAFTSWVNIKKKKKALGYTTLMRKRPFTYFGEGFYVVACSFLFFIEIGLV